MIQPLQILAARTAMQLGSSMKDAAIGLGIRSCELDRALWEYLEVPTSNLVIAPTRRKRKPEPMW